MALEGELDVTVAEESVWFTFTVTNTGPDEVNLQFADACKADFTVLDEGREVWRYTEGRVFAQVIGDETIPPDESITYDGEWTDPQSGEFTAVAELCAQDEHCDARADFAI